MKTNIFLRNSLLKWELGGIPAIFLAGALFHFLYDWSGQNRFIALIAPVNESVWEHLKMGVWPAFFYTVFEYGRLKTQYPNFWTAKTAAAYIIPLVAALLFYTYTAFTGRNLLFMDILIFIIAVILGQWVSYRIIELPPFSPAISKVSLFALATILFVFAALTFSPPHLPIFQDPRNGSYGVPQIISLYHSSFLQSLLQNKQR